MARGLEASGKHVHLASIIAPRAEWRAHVQLLRAGALEGTRGRPYSQPLGTNVDFVKGFKAGYVP